MDYNTKVIIPTENTIVKIIAVKNLLTKLITVHQNIINCALVDCNHPAMTALFEYRGFLAYD